MSTKIIFKSIWIYVALATICGLFAATGIKTWVDKQTTIAMLSAAFFGGCALFFTYRLISPRYKFMNPASKEYMDYLEQQNKDRSNDTGIFTYENDMFKFEMDGAVKSYTWNNIETVLAYKADMRTYDLICQTVTMDDGYILKLDEDTAGWFQFQKRLAQNFPQISIDWLITIAEPPFKTNTTLLYDRHNRSLEDIMKENKE